MVLYELDDSERAALTRMVVERVREDLNEERVLDEVEVRAGERVQRFWCAGCESWHEGSVLGGVVGGGHEG